MAELFQTSSDNNLELCSQFEEECIYPFLEDDAYDLPLEGQSDEIASLEQSYPSSSVPNSPNASESSPSEPCASEPNEEVPDQESTQTPHSVIFPSYAAVAAAANQKTVEQAAEPKMPVIKREVCEPVVRAEPVVRPAPTATRVQPASKRARAATAQQSAPAAESKLPDLLNADSMDSYMQSLAKGKSEDIELFRNVLRCNGSLTPEAEKQLKHLARQVKNRESAQLSRQRKREYVQTLKSVIDKMRSVDSALRTDLNTAQVEAAQNKAEAERWQNYTCELQKLLQEHGIEVPKIPDAPAQLVLAPSRVIPQVVFPESLFDGPCGFGHMAATKCSGKRRARSTKAKEQKETKA